MALEGHPSLDLGLTQIRVTSFQLITYAKTLLPNDILF